MQHCRVDSCPRALLAQSLQSIMGATLTRRSSEIAAFGADMPIFVALSMPAFLGDSCGSRDVSHLAL
jgi:hypothetical protein